MLIRRSRFCCLVALVLGFLALPGRGDVVILKDGYAIHGKVGTEQTIIVDPGTGDSIQTRKLNGLSMIDDGPRLTVFSGHYKRIGDVDPQNKFADQVQYLRPIIRQTNYPLPPVMQLVSASEFNARWQRKLVYANDAIPDHPYQIFQQIDIITPHYVRMNSTTHNWFSYYLTSELGSEKVRKLLATHPEFDEKKGPDAGKRAKVIRFLIQANWLREAEDEIERMLKDLPSERMKADEFRDAIRDMRLDKTMTDIELAKDCGQHDFARRVLGALPKDKLSAKLSLKVAGLKAEYDAATAKMEKAKRYLKELQELTATGYKDLIQAADFILAELYLDGIGRLDIFLALAEQAETARKANLAPQHKPEELLSAAVCGWLLGNIATETNLETARKRLKARQFALDYLRDPSAPKRRASVLAYVGDSEALPFDELEKLISLLPPPEAEKDISSTAGLKKTGPLPNNTAAASYLLKLPPEYQHGRAYPLLLVLPQGGERLTDTLKKLGDLPGKNGFILAIVDWATGFGALYNYTEEEQLLVTGLLRHLRRTLQVDSDKVFLFGEGEGANFALDLGATHSDLFAGVVPMTASPDWQLFQIFAYWKNFQNLPVYMIFGDRVGEAGKTIRAMLTNWMPRGYPVLAVSYKGRGYDWFGEELPYVFDWMSRKTRPTAFPDLGRTDEEYRTVRASSNRFYWIGTEEIDPNHLYDPERKNNRIFPATVQAHRTEGNQITVTLMWLKQVSIWLGRGSIDFTKPVYVTIKDRGTTWKKEISPKISVLLEDLYDRGDRQRPYFQRIDWRDMGKGIFKFTAE